MVGRRLVLILFVLFIPGLVSASVAIDSVRQARVMVYNVLNLDTTGTANLPTGLVDQFVNMGICQVNEDLSAYQRSDSIQTQDNTQMYYLDSMINIIGCWLVSDGELEPLVGMAIDSLGRYSLSTINNTTEEKPELYYKWGDSIGFMPEPNEVDTYNIYYVHIVPIDSMRLIPYKYRYGVVLWAAYMSAMSTSMPSADRIMQTYESFVIRKKAELNNK